MLTNLIFVDAYKKVCSAYNRESKPDQAQFFFNELKGFNDEDVPVAVSSLVAVGRLPNLKDWIVAFSDAKRKNRKAPTTEPFGYCPKCSADTFSKKCDDGEWYEICVNGDYKEILYTFSEWKALAGYDGLSPFAIAKQLRIERSQ